MAEDKKHELGPIERVVNIRNACSIYKDYDGNAPDGDIYCRCATRELAEEVCSIMAVAEVHNKMMACADDLGEEYAPDYDELVAKLPEHVRPHAMIVLKALTNQDVGWPVVDGWEHAASWRFTVTQEEETEIATTLTEAVDQLLNN